MTNLTRPLLAGFGNAHFIMGLHLGDLKNADAVRRARNGDGASISWIVGHLLNYRCAVLRAIGVEHPNPYQEKFSFQSPATDGGDYPDIAELLADWNALHGKLNNALGDLTEDRLLGETDLHGGDGSLLGALTFHMWHEAYHIGIMGLLRVEWGYRHTHEMVMDTK